MLPVYLCITAYMDIFIVNPPCNNMTYSASILWYIFT